MCHPRRARPARGVAIVYGVLALTVVLAISTLAVDYGRAQLVRTELQSAADGAARAAASGLSTSQAEAKKRARDLAKLNRADAAEIKLADGDFKFGRWDQNTSTIDTGASPADAVEVTARRTVLLTFASFFGKDSTDVSARATARSAPSASYRGFAGLNGVEFHNNGYIGSYRSSVTTTPTPAASTGKGIVSSNVVVDFKNNADVSGDVVLGPSGELIKKNNFTITGSVINNPAPSTPPADPPWTPAPNPNGVPANYTINSNTTLPGGTYWFTNLNLNKRLTFSGPATVYVNGNIRSDDAIVTYQNKPSNLKIFVLGNNRLIDLQKDISLYAEVQAPGAALEGNNKMYLYGSGIFRSILSKNNSEFYFDENASSATEGGIALVK